jgi:hypothetical protein
MIETVKERKLFETTQYLITIANRLMGNLPFGLEEECYFISEDVKEALKNIGTKQALLFVKEIEKAELQKRFSRKKIMSKKFLECICYKCPGHTQKNSPDCACDDEPTYDIKSCMDCPKRYFCDVTKQPWLYREV